MATDAPRPNNGSAKVNRDQRRPNTVGLCSGDLTIFLDRLEHAAPGKAGNRDFVRWPFRQTAVRMEVIHPGSGRIPLDVACRNLSRTGMSVLHNAFMHTGVRCTMVIPHPGRGEVRVEGTVVRCTHRSGMIHEIGIRFEEQLDVRELVRHDPFSDCFSLERVRPEQLTGTLLCVDPSEMSVKILRHFLRETSLRVRVAGGIAGAVASVEGNEDLIICDFHLPDGDGAALVGQLRARDVRAPIIVTTSDTSAQTRKTLVQAKASALLAKPYTQETLLRAVAEFLIVQPAGEHDDATVNPEASALVDAFIQAAPVYALKLQQAVRAGNAAAIRDLCFQISGAAPTVGFRELGELADLAGRAVAKDGNLAAAAAGIRAVISSCERIRPRAVA